MPTMPTPALEKPDPMKDALKKVSGVTDPLAAPPVVDAPPAPPAEPKPGEVPPADPAKPAEPAAIAPKDPAEPPAPAPTPPAPAPKKIQRPDARDFLPVEVAPPTPAPEPLAFTPTTDEVDYLETVKFGEVSGAVPKGTAAAEVARMKADRDAVAAAEAQWKRENPGQVFNAATAELGDGTRVADVLKPAAVDATTRRILERKKDLADAKAIADNAAASARAEAARLLAEKDLRGKLTETAAAAEGLVITGVKLDDDPEVDAELKKIAREQGLTALAEAMPAEGGAAVAAATQAAKDAALFTAIRAGVTGYNPDSAQHAQIANLIWAEGSAFIAAGAPLAAGDPRAGKIFVTLDQFDRLRPEVKGRFATFTDDECRAIIAERAAREANLRIAGIQNQRKKSDELRAKLRLPKAPATSSTAPAAKPGSTPAPEPKPDSVKLGLTPQGVPTNEKREPKNNPFAIKSTVWPKK